ncbi:MAG: UbiX family flavin prenyltransferase [Bacteroidales bacterium]|jgi:4-hydroxy-3-polyprenylbenzoate decarboxylase|nr:UbiX family flavin prenyltransferase [Bacteroidales bacterium]MZP67285.1 UbiX family flavin prenyltransferase [Bacteroidales bacterium]
MKNRKIIVAITGASGAVYAVKLLERLRSLRAADTLRVAQPKVKAEQSNLLPETLQEVAVILTGNAEDIMLYETGAGYTPSGNEKLWSNKDFNAPFASGSSSYDTMIICPASMGMVGRIAHGVSDDLITRAADVMLKERRRLILVPRETPYSLIHINNMKLLTEAGAIICPATPSFYSRPQTIDDLVMTVIERVLTLAGFTIDAYRWNEE